MRYPSIAILLAYLLILSACAGIENAQCLPIPYRDRDQGEIVSYEVNRYREKASFSEVTGYFNLQLDPIDHVQDAELDEWQVEKIDEKQVLYYCLGAINSFEGELGCIYVRDETDHTLIETVWYLSGDAGPWCEPTLSVVR